VARKGVGLYRLDVVGRAAHAGLEPERGINATIEAAAQILAIHRLSDPSVGTTVTPTVVAAGTVSNTVPAAAKVTVDVRTESVEEMQRVETGLRSLSPTVPGAAVSIVAESVRPPLERRWSEQLFAHARSLAPDVGIADLTGVAVGGGSDGNLTAAIGVPTLDGLGAVGGGAHAEGEWVSVSAMPSRTSLVTALVRNLLEERDA
jgi:glutamate carboxypeptidase